MLDYKILKKIKKNVFLVSLFYLFIFLHFLNQKKILSANENLRNESFKKINSVLVEKIEVSKFNKKIILRGQTQHSRQVIIKSQVEGKISAINFSKGSNVSAGDIIVLIDPEDKIAKQKEMEALLEQRKKEYEVAEKLFKGGFRSEVKLSESRTNFEKALASFEKSQVALNNTKVMIPFDSFLEDSFVELGDYLKKGDKIVKIVDLDPMFLSAFANESEVMSLKVNQEGFAILNNGEKFKGHINYISSSADTNTRNFKIQLEIKNPKKKILSGLSGEIQVDLAPTNAFFIPASVVTLSQNGDLGIKIIKDNKVKFFKINIISDTGKGFWIKTNNFNELLLISRGQEFVIEGESVDYEFLVNDVR
ncbi:MAG: hypothetical protein CMP25_00780 [Rickettsiales bacterium]|nr:hypothetical protein [Rickettsiales bacterium]